MLCDYSAHSGFVKYLMFRSCPIKSMWFIGLSLLMVACQISKTDLSRAALKLATDQHLGPEWLQCWAGAPQTFALKHAFDWHCSCWKCPLDELMLVRRLPKTREVLWSFIVTNIASRGRARRAKIKIWGVCGVVNARWGSHLVAFECEIWHFLKFCGLMLHL